MGIQASADPAGYVDGYNLYVFNQQNPIVNTDRNGTDTKNVENVVYKAAHAHQSLVTQFETAKVKLDSAELSLEKAQWKLDNLNAGDPKFHNHTTREFNEKKYKSKLKTFENNVRRSKENLRKAKESFSSIEKKLDQSAKKLLKSMKKAAKHGLRADDVDEIIKSGRFDADAGKFNKTGKPPNSGLKSRKLLKAAKFAGKIFKVVAVIEGAVVAYKAGKHLVHGEFGKAAREVGTFLYAQTIGVAEDVYDLGKGAVNWVGDIISGSSNRSTPKKPKRITVEEGLAAIALGLAIVLANAGVDLSESQENQEQNPTSSSSGVTVYDPTSDELAEPNLLCPMCTEQDMIELEDYLFGKTK